MNLAKFPRRVYIDRPTPIEKLCRLGSHLNGVNVYIKRDDLLMGLLGGGNKIRQLEFLMADVLNSGADTVITCGAVQSNHCRLALAACVKEGLDCHLVIEERIPDSFKEITGGNTLLYNLMGVKGITVVKGGSDMNGEMKKVADSLSAKGMKPYIMPGGGSSALGALGYMACVHEIIGQLYEMGLEINEIVCASGSGGTHTGLVCGMVGMGANIPVMGITTSRSGEAQKELIFGKCNDASDLLGLKPRPGLDDIVTDGGYVGEGYARPTEGMAEAVKFLASAEGILLDPVYTGKAMAGLIDLARKGRYLPGQNVLFLHTGGSPALYAYPESLFD